MDEDSTLYNAMIWALSIGIIVVIVTLFLTRPAPEAFTELYFNNHATLPEYVNLNNNYNYSFSMHNLLNKDNNYTYSITTELYNLDYSCIKPELYLETTNTSRYEKLLVNQIDLPTRTTTTNNPELLIKQSDYSISFNYDIKSGEQLVIRFLSVEDKEKYAIVINHASSTLYFVNGQNISKTSLKLTDKTHTVNLIMNKNTMSIKVDDNSIKIATPKDYTTGFLSFETTNSYIEITNLYINRADAKEYVNMKIADAVYKENTLELQNGTITEYQKFLVNTALQDTSAKPLITTMNPATSRYYYAKDAAPIMASTVTATFKTDDLTIIGLRPFQIIYNPKTSSISFSDELNHSNTPIQSFTIQKTTDFNTINAIFDGNTARIYYNTQYITTLNNIIDNESKMFIESNGPISIRDLSIKTNDKPSTIKYVAPEAKQSVTYATIYTSNSFQNIRDAMDNTTANITALTADQRKAVQDFYNAERLNWTNYKFVAQYWDLTKDNTFKISMNSLEEPLYAVSLDSKAQKAYITYYQNNTPINITKPITVTTSLSTLQIDSNNGAITMTFNGQVLLSARIDKATDGIILLDYGTISLNNAQATNKDTGEVRIYKKSATTECQPMNIYTYRYTGNEMIKDTQTKIFNSHVIFNQPFDIAKVQVDIGDGQEIHFWVKNI